VGAAEDGDVETVNPGILSLMKGGICDRAPHCYLAGYADGCGLSIVR
jgi:hypothetical protein